MDASDTRIPLPERILSPIADVRQGELSGVLLQALNLFLVLAAYYMLKTVRESLILTVGGAAIKAYSAAGQALMLPALVPAFGAFASRVNRSQLIRWVTLFFVFNIVVFWAFANDLYTPDQGRRLSPLIGLGSSLGAPPACRSRRALDEARLRRRAVNQGSSRIPEAF